MLAPSSALFHKINFLLQTSCVLTYDGSQQAVGGIYAIALTLEGFPAGTANFGSVTPFSGIPLQFLVMVIGNHTGHCHEKPSFTASTPKDGECSDVPIGSAYSAVIEVQVADFSKSYVYRTRIDDQDCLVFHFFFLFHSQTKYLLIHGRLLTRSNSLQTRNGRVRRSCCSANKKQTVSRSLELCFIGAATE